MMLIIYRNIMKMTLLLLVEEHLIHLQEGGTLLLLREEIQTINENNI